MDVIQNELESFDKNSTDIYVSLTETTVKLTNNEVVDLKDYKYSRFIS